MQGDFGEEANRTGYHEGFTIPAVTTKGMALPHREAPCNYQGLDGQAVYDFTVEFQLARSQKCLQSFPVTQQEGQ